MIQSKVVLVVFTFFYIYSGADAVANLTSIPMIIDGVLTACPGDLVSITCSHNITANGALTEWMLPGVSSLCLVRHGSSPPNCSPFTVTMVSDSSGPILSSTVQINATEGLSGEVQCLSESGAVLDSVNISITAIPTPSITIVEQINQSMVNVNMSVDSVDCASTYVVNGAQISGSNLVSGSNSALPVTLDGLDVCNSSYVFVGYVITDRGVEGDMSSPFNFTANLSEVNGVFNVSDYSERTVLQWNQMPNTDYPTCITSYSISWGAGVTYNTINTTTLVAREQLNAINFPFCETTSVTVTPVTPMGLLVGRDSTGNVSLIAPDFVTPILSGDSTLVNVTRSIMVNMNGTNDTVSITVQRIQFSGMVQGISQIVNPAQMVGYSQVSMTCTPDTMFTDDSFEVILPDNAASGEMFRVCVQLTFGDCSEMAFTDITIPPRNTTPKNEVVDGTSFAVNVSLPITEYRPDELRVNISLTPPDVGPLTENFSSDYQLTVTFSGLMHDTNYTYTVRIVRRSDGMEVAPSFSADFAIAPLPTTLPTTVPTTMATSSGTAPPTSTPDGNIGTIIGIVVGILAVVAILIVIAVIILICWWNKSKKSASVTISSDHEMGTKLTGNNGDGAASKPETPTPDSIENPDVILAKSEPEPATTASDSAALIYADLDIGKNKPKPSSGGASATSPTGSASGGQEDVQYADINFVKSTTAEEN